MPVCKWCGYWIPNKKSQCSRCGARIAENGQHISSSADVFNKFTAEQKRITHRLVSRAVEETKTGKTVSVSMQEQQNIASVLRTMTDQQRAVLTEMVNEAILNCSRATNSANSSVSYTSQHLKAPYLQHQGGTTMPHCMNCGQQLVNGAKFCFACGTPAGETARSNQRQQEWAGKLIPCPSCGENLPSFTAVCPACEYEIRGAKATNSVTVLAEKLSVAKNEEEKCMIIRAFPIPNTREDILEFFILSSTNFDVAHDSLDIANAWKIKIEQCYEKAKLTLANDPEFFQIEQGYGLAYKKIKEHNTKQTGFKIAKGIFGGIGTVLLTVMKGIGKFIGMIFGGLLSLFNIGLDDTGKILSKSLLVILSTIIFGAAIITNDDTSSADYALVGGVILILSACTLIRKKVSGAEFFIYALAGCATFYFSRYASDEVGALMVLVGAIVIFIVVVDYFVYLHRNK